MAIAASSWRPQAEVAGLPQYNDPLPKLRARVTDYHSHKLMVLKRNMLSHKNSYQTLPSGVFEAQSALRSDTVGYFFVLRLISGPETVKKAEIVGTQKGLTFQMECGMLNSMIGRRLLEIVLIGVLIWYFLSLKFFLGLAAGLIIAGEVYGSRGRSDG